MFTVTTKGARNWKRLVSKTKIFMRTADLTFLTTAHEMFSLRRDDDLAYTRAKLLPSGMEKGMELLRQA